MKVNISWKRLDAPFTVVNDKSRTPWKNALDKVVSCERNPPPPPKPPPEGGRRVAKGVGAGLMIGTEGVGGDMMEMLI